MKFSPDTRIIDLTVKDLTALITGLIPQQQPEPVKESSEDLLTTNQVAEKFNLSLSTIWKYRKDGVFPFYRLGGKVLFDEKEIREAIKKANIRRK